MKKILVLILMLCLTSCATITLKGDANSIAMAFAKIGVRQMVVRSVDGPEAIQTVREKLDEAQKMLESGVEVMAVKESAIRWVNESNSKPEEKLLYMDLITVLDETITITAEREKIPYADVALEVIDWVREALTLGEVK